MRREFYRSVLLKPELAPYRETETSLLTSDRRIETQVPPGWSHPKCPNFGDWLPGDIFLVRSNGNAPHRAIEVAQRTSLNRATREGSVYVHAAVYVGNGEIVDITPKLGVARRSVWEYCERHAIALRRLPYLSPTDSDAIAVTANELATQGLSYSWGQLVLSKLVPKTIPQPEKLYCSTLVGHVFEQACDIQLHAQPMYRPLYPGTLAEHQALDVVLLEWRTVP